MTFLNGEKMSLFGKKKRKEKAEKVMELKNSSSQTTVISDTNMELFSRKARGTEIPKKGQRIFLCCCEEDRTFRDALTDDLLSQDAGADCVVSWLNDDAVAGNDELYDELLESKVVILAVTDSFLNRMKKGKKPEAFSFAEKQEIPLLPVAEDSGLLQRFNEAAGAVHVIAATDIEYRSKLRSQLENFLVTKELYSKIMQCAFSASLFLSYRKKDLKEARVFMQRFHAITGFETVAVWYDNYLTAGRVFDSEIRESIDKSDAFVLLVTPNLMEPGNYVLTTEYPYAKDEAQKQILAVEAVRTDKSDFDRHYPFVNAYADLDSQESMFRSSLPEGNSLNDPGPEQLFCLGMAYLKAILVERNADYAIRFLSEAASFSDPFGLQAAEQMAIIFEFGTVKPIDYDAALLWRKRYLELCEELYGKDCIEAAAAYNNLGLVYEKQGKINDAEAALKDDLAICLKTLGREHPDTAITYNNLGELLWKTGDYENALKMTEEALSIRKQTLGEDDPSLASSYNNLSAICSMKGELGQALAFSEKAVDILERTRGSNSTETAIAYGNTASVLDELERYEEALSYALKCVSIFESSLGIAHIDTAVAYKKLSRIYSSLAEYDKAYQTMSISLETARRILGEDHRDTVDYYGEMGDILQMLHRFSEADEMYAKALDILEKTENPPKEVKSHLLTARAMNMQNAGDYEGALTQYQKALVYSQTTFGEDHPDVGAVLNDMGVLYRLMGDNEEALTMYEKALLIREKVFGEHSQTVSTTCNNMALVCQLMGEYDRALNLYQRSLSIDTALFGEGHPDIAVTCSNLALLCFVKQDTGKALEYAERSVRIAENGQQKGWPPMAVPYNTMAIILGKTGQYTESLEYGLRAFRIWNEELPPDHPNLKQLFNTLGHTYTASGHSVEEFYEWADKNGLLM